MHWSEGRLVINRNEKLDDSIQELRSQVLAYYHARPVTEIWNSSMLSNLFQQIIFCVTIRAFADQEFIKEVVRDVERLVRDLRRLTEAEEGQLNGQPKPAYVYLNEYGNYLNMVLFEAQSLKATFIGYDMPHFIVTHDRRFYDFSKDWVNKIRRRSVLISAEGYQNREWFFLNLEMELQRFKDNVSKMVAVYYP